ncbi:hypothetical protein A9973_22875 [Achromobacter sp. UMC46]|nr:hypothetical protein [Achromobacter sp. UMC46]
MQHGRGIGAVAWNQRNADASANQNRIFFFHIIGLRDRLHDSVANRLRFGLRTLADQQHEFIAADARRHGTIGHQRQQAFGYLLQQCVAGSMPVGVVDRLESVQVQIQHGEFHASRAGVRHGLVQCLEQPVAVQQAGQRVLARVPLVLAFGQHGRHQHAVQPVGRHRHRRHIKRHLHQDQPENGLFSEEGTHRTRSDA